MIFRMIFAAVFASLTSLVQGAAVNNTIRDAGNDRLVCGHFATADAKNINSMMANMVHFPYDVKVEARKCRRVDCWNTSGIYLCNDEDHEITKNTGSIVGACTFIYSDCCKMSRSRGSPHAQSGQYFLTDVNANVVIGYANCNDPDDFRPSDYIYPGPNGKCVP